MKFAFLVHKEVDNENFAKLNLKIVVRMVLNLVENSWFLVKVV